MKINPKSYVLFDYTGTYSVVPKSRHKDLPTFKQLYKSTMSISIVARANLIVDLENGEVLKCRIFGFRRAKYYPWFVEQIKNLLEK